VITHEEIFERRIETAACGDYGRALLAAVESWAERSRATTGHDLALVCELRPDGIRSIRVFVRPEGSANMYGDLQEQLHSSEPPPVAFGPVRFQLNLLLWGGQSVGP